MKNKSLSLLTVGIFSFLVVSASVRAAHYLNHLPGNHLPGQNNPAPTPAQIAKFCKEYPNKKPSEQLQRKKQYDQYCNKPLIKPIAKPQPPIKPIAKKSVITRLVIKGKCVSAKDKIQILGRNFGKQGSVQLKGSLLKVRGWTTTNIRVVLGSQFTPGKRYTLSVKTAAGESNQKSLLVCKKVPQLQAIGVPVPSLVPLPGKADLTVSLNSPNKATAGKVIPMLRMEAKNQGKAQAKGFTLELVLSKYRRLTKRMDLTGLMKKMDGLVLETIRLTTPLAPNGRKTYFPVAKLPADIAAGEYSLCARIDPSDKVKESKEKNNSYCKLIKVAAAKKGAPAVVQLRKGIFGRRVGLAAGKDFKPELKTPKIQPEQRQLTDMHMTLTINGSPFSANIPADETGNATIRWNFPRSSYVTRSFLRIKRGAIAPGDPKCPPAGTSESAGRSLMDGWDSGDLGLPGRGEHGRGRTLSPGGTYDLGRYEAGQYYSIVACGMRRIGGYGRDGGYIYGLGSNVVTMRVRPTGTALLPAENLTEPLTFPLPELEHVLAGRVWIQASGLAPITSTDPRLVGASLIGDGDVMFSLPGFNVLIRKGPLSILGYVPGSRDEYEYVLVVSPFGSGYTYCRNAAHTASPVDFVSAVSGDAVVDKPDIAGDGRINRLYRAESTRTLFTHVSVPQETLRVLSYYVRLYVVGTSPPGSGRSGLQAVCSNVVTVRIVPSR